MDPEDREQFKTLHAICSKPHGALTSANDQPRCSLPVAADRTRLLLGSYRKGDAEDPDVYTSAVAAVLAQYPESVVRRVTDPRGGLPGTSQWLPTVHEVRAACEREMAPERERMRREANRARTDAICASGAEIDAERRKQVAQEIRKRMAALDTESTRKREPWRMSPEEAEAYMREIAARPVAPLSAAALERRS